MNPTDPTDDMTYEQLVDGIADCIDFGEDGIADWVGTALVKKHPEFDYESPSDMTPEAFKAEDIARTEVILDALRRTTAQYEARLNELKGQS